MFSISRTHGPSAIDAIGIGTILVDWILLLRVIWRGRSAVRRSALFPVGVVLVGAGAAVVALAVSLDFGWWWVAGAVPMAAVQALTLGLATNAANSP